MSPHSVRNIFERLQSHFGRQHWWPGDTPDEVLAGCVLAQNTRWERVVPVIDGLKSGNLLSPTRLAGVPVGELADLLRGSGTYRRKARYLKDLAAFFRDHGWNGNPGSLSHQETTGLRRDLLGIGGIGPETADCILLYVLERPVFVIDAYTKRILQRHGLCTANASYQELQEMFESALDRDPAIYGEYHALLVVCAKTFCRPEPRCQGCPLRDLLPGDGEP